MNLVAQVLRHLFPVLYRASAELDVDVALVTNEHDVFAAAQAERVRLAVPWPLSPSQMAAGKRLADAALAGDLVLFLGSGVSTGSGLSTWGSLLDDLAKVVGLGPEPPSWSSGGSGGASTGVVTFSSVPGSGAANAGAATSTSAAGAADITPAERTAGGGVADRDTPPERIVSESREPMTTTTTTAAATAAATAATTAATTTTATPATTTAAATATATAAKPVLSPTMDVELQRHKLLVAEFKAMSYLDQARLIER